MASTFCAWRADDIASRMAHDSGMARKKRVADRQQPIHYLRQWRELRRPLSQQKLAERAGISASMVSRLETGESNLTRDTAAALAAALLIDVIDLFRDPNDPHGSWSLARNLERLPPAQRKMIETMINALLSEANGQP